MTGQELFERLSAGYNYDPMYGQVITERDRLREENAQLRQQLADVTMSVGRMEEQCAKLKELVRMDEECASHTDCVESCPYHYESGGWWECKRDDLRASLGLADDE